MQKTSGESMPISGSDRQIYLVSFTYGS